MSEERYDWNAIVAGLNRFLRLRSIPIGMKLFETVEAMEAIPRIRRPRARHTTDQIVAQARQLGWTVGITMADLVGAQCGAVIGLHPQDEEWLSGRRMAGVWFETREDAAAHQRAMDVVPHGRYRAMAVSPPLTRSPTRTRTSTSAGSSTSVLDPNWMRPSRCPRSRESFSATAHTMRRATTPAICLTVTRKSPSLSSISFRSFCVAASFL